MSGKQGREEIISKWRRMPDTATTKGGSAGERILGAGRSGEWGERRAQLPFAPAKQPGWGCVRHGAYGVCSAVRSHTNARSGVGLYDKHGAMGHCSFPGCSTKAQTKGGLCGKHGGG
jgi:hypothetical protein